MIKYFCNKDNIETSESICPHCKARTEMVSSEIYWCDTCNIPLFSETCECCGTKGKRVSTDMRPVFPEERLLLEIVLGKPFCFLKDNIWNGSGNIYYVNGKRLPFSIKKLKEQDSETLRSQLQVLEKDNTYQYFEEYTKKFIKANAGRYNAIVKEANDYIQAETRNCKPEEMFISFSGGKDSTVTADLVMRALANPKILHIFGDTTLEFPETMEYVKRYKISHPKTPVISSRNKEKNFEELCRLVGPPSRVMRWCCTIFKTGAIQRQIGNLFKKQNKIITFYGIRRSESKSRSKYERESNSPKIMKQITISPIIDWLDFDIWLYLLTTGIDFNRAYRLGYARVGCWCCPNNSGWSEFLSRIYMPEQSQKFRNMLIEFATQIGKPDPEVYVDEGSWKARQGGNGVNYAQNTVVAFKPCVLEENAFNYELRRPISQNLYELFKPFGTLDFQLGNSRLGEVYVLNRKQKPVLRLQGRIGSKELKVSILDQHIAGATSYKGAEDKVKCQLTKYQLCMGCLACESICKQDAISIKEMPDGSIDYKVLDDKCIRCGECIDHYNAGCYMKKVLTIKKQ